MIDFPLVALVNVIVDQDNEQDDEQDLVVICGTTSHGRRSRLL
jgi:hypothetical protein